MKIETYTGEAGIKHNLLMKFGKDFIVIVFDEDAKMFALRDIKENKDLIDETINTANVMEWTRVRAMNFIQAKKNAYAAHAQYYDKLNGIKNWVDSAKLGIQS